MELLTQKLANKTPQGATIGVACSGGVDSLVLLHAACAAGLNPIALHIDHGIHADSASWAQHVHEQALTYGARYDSHVLTGLSAGMPSLENAARMQRHKALAMLCERHSVNVLLLAHHANDQAETVLLNLLRGTGLGGVGMPTKRVQQGLTWLRPWLDVPKHVLLDYAHAHKLVWIDDPSNTDTDLRRNAVRHQLWPMVEQVEPRALTSLLRFSDIALEAANTEHALAAQVLRNFIDPADGTVDWHAMVKGQQAATQMALLRAWLAQLGCKPPTQAHGLAMLAQLSAQTGAGLRCKHEQWHFVYQNKRLHAHKVELG